MNKRIELAGMEVKRNLKENFGRKSKWEKLRSRPRQQWAVRANHDLCKCTEGLTISDNMDRDKWRHLVEVTKVLKVL